MLGVAPVHARVLVGAALLCAGGCAGKRPFELPEPSEVPPHVCADVGVAECERACNEQADGDACLVASIAHAEGLGGPEDRASMQAFELRACELGVALGCEYYANNFWRSEDEDELDVAREHYERACRGGRDDACTRAANLALRLDAEGRPRDARAAFELYGPACEAGVAWACTTRGDMSTFGIGTSVDVEGALESYRKACAAGDPAGCHNAEAGRSEHWLAAATTTVLLESLHAPNPDFAVEAPNGWKTKVATRICFTHEAIEPVEVRIIESSGLPELDAIVQETLQGWRVRARPGWKLEQPVCMPFVFDIRKE